MPNLLGHSFSRRELARRVGNFSQLFGVDLLSCGDGRERAVRLLGFRTGAGLEFDILVDRCGPQILGSSSRGVRHEIVLVVKPAQKWPRDHTKTIRKRMRSAL